MPALGTKCVNSFNQSLDIASATETLWLTANPASAVRKQLKTPQLEALYEATFLRVFSAYESFLEDVLAHYMAGYETPTYTPTVSATGTIHATVTSALTTLHTRSNGSIRSYLLWHDAQTTIDRATRNLNGCPVETVLSANKVDLDDYAKIRHHIAHNSRDSGIKFAAAASRLTGSEYSRRPGKLLRSADISDPLNPTKWIRVIVDDMAATVLQICP